MIIGNLIDPDTIFEDVSEEKVAHVYFNDNPGRGQHYLRMIVGYDERDAVLGHWFEYFTYDGVECGTVKASNDANELPGYLPKLFIDEAMEETETFLANDYESMKAGTMEGDGEL